MDRSARARPGVDALPLAARSVGARLKALLLDCGLAADATADEADRMVDAIGRGRLSDEAPPRADATRAGG